MEVFILYGFKKFSCFISALLLCAALLAFCPRAAYADMEASSSDAAGPGTEEVLLDELEDPGSPVLDSVVALTRSGASETDSTDDFVNVLRFDASISGTDYILLFPADFKDDLMVDSSGNLWNVSDSTVSGRAFPAEDGFDPYADTGTLIYLTSCLGNNFSSNHEYGSPNYLREYTWTESSYGDRLSYTDTYVQITDCKSYHPFYVSDTNVYILIVLIGGCLLCLWKKSVR